MDKHIKLLIKSSKEFEQVCENALFEIKNQERISLIIGSLRPPSTNLDQSLYILSDQLQDALSTTKPKAIMGDLNVNSLEKDDSYNTILEEL